MLSKEELLKNIDELYEAYIKSERERLRHRNLNAFLRGKYDKLKGEISAKDVEITALKKELETLRANPPQGTTFPQRAITPQETIGSLFSSLPDGFLSLDKTPSTGGIDVANFWKKYIGRYHVAGINLRYNFFIGYLYEYRGWRVYYEYNDKRIICHKGKRLIVIATEDGGIINNNAIYALVSRAMRLKMVNPSFKVSAACITSGTLNQGVRIAANSFGISAREDFPFQNFPYVKCKVLPDRKVYYTPNDKEYFTTRIIPANDDIFCRTMNDALETGFQPS